MKKASKLLLIALLLLLSCSGNEPITEGICQMSTSDLFWTVFFAVIIGNFFNG